ncbi:hypothetical protein XENTR_v10010848 [Xenopus tropicalis]|nr:hypothetical protein XENTR_v10010848 [Xenopus tropicalis]
MVNPFFTCMSSPDILCACIYTVYYSGAAEDIRQTVAHLAMQGEGRTSHTCLWAVLLDGPYYCINTCTRQ